MFGLALNCLKKDKQMGWRFLGGGKDEGIDVIVTYYRKMKKKE